MTYVATPTPQDDEHICRARHPERSEADAGRCFIRSANFGDRLVAGPLSFSTSGAEARSDGLLLFVGPEGPTPWSCKAGANSNTAGESRSAEWRRGSGQYTRPDGRRYQEVGALAPTFDGVPEPGASAPEAVILRFDDLPQNLGGLSSIYRRHRRSSFPKVVEQGQQTCSRKRASF